ncbi:MAG: FHA domain-containing protein, partial [Candidatus Krumholzibacteriia bacterium]
AVVDGALGARFTAAELALPAAVTLRLASAGAALEADGTLRARRALARRGLGRGPALLLAALVLVVAAVVLVRLRFASAGELVVTVDGRETVRRLPRSGATIGSAAGNTIVVPDPRVSPQHAVLRVRGGAIIVTDLRSATGTQVNERPVRTATIGEGDRVLLGGAVRLVYRRTTRPGRLARPGRRGGS